MATRTPPRRPALVAVAAAGVLALALSGCGSSGGSGADTTGAPAGSPPLGTTAPTDTAGSAGSSALSSSLVAKANDEGKVVLYTTISAGDIKGMVAAFNEDYPKITVQALRLTGAQVPARVEAEQRGGAFKVDVVTADAPEVMALVHADALTPFDPPSQPTLPAGLSLPAGYTGIAYLLTSAIAYNPSAVNSAGLTPPTSWEDLTKPEWKGRFSVDPTALDWYEMLIASMGHDKALSLLQALGDNSPVPVESHTQALTQVQSGQQLVAATAYGYKAASMKKKDPTTMGFVNPDPLPMALNLVDIAKNPPHPAAAKVFEDWLVSQDGQRAVVEVTNHTSLRDDVGNDPTVFDPDKWKPVYADSDITNEQYNAYMTELKQALHAQ